VSPKNIIEISHASSSGATTLGAVKKTTPKKWLLFKTYPHSSLLPVRRNGPSSPLLLSAELPNGTYLVSALCNSKDGIPLSPDKLGFKFRFYSRGIFGLPKNIEFAKQISKKFFSYLELGQVKVKNERINFEIIFNPPAKTSYSIRHIKFIPNPGKHKQSAISDEKQQNMEKINRLKSLGYL